VERIPQFLIQKPFLFGGIAAVIDADELRKAEFAAVKKVEFHTPGPHDQIRLRIRLRRTAQRQAETGHFEYHTPLTPVSAQRHQLAAHRIEPPQGVEPQRIAVHGSDGIFTAGTAAELAGIRSAVCAALRSALCAASSCGRSRIRINSNRFIIDTY
jgi:hypothetical protein